MAAMPSLRELEPVVARVCTEKEREVLALRAADYSWRQIESILGVSKATCCDRLRNAMRKIQAELGVA